MSSFLEILNESIASTIEGLTGVRPEVSIIEEEAELVPPLIQVNFNAIGEKAGHAALLVTPRVSNLITDLMLGGEGEAKDEVTEEDLDSAKEIMSNIMGTVSTTLKAQKDLPDISFKVQNAIFISETDIVDTTGFDAAYPFYIKMNDEEGKIFLLLDKPLKLSLVKDKKEEKSKNECSEDKFELSEDELKNISLILDVKLPVRVRIGYTSPEEREKIKKALELINSFGPLEAPRVIECEAVEKIKKILEE